MATYSAITSGQVDAESYFDTTLAQQYQNNVLAMFEGDASASGVRLQQAALAASLTPWELIESQTASASSSIDFEALATGTYKRFMLVIGNLRPASDNAIPFLRVGTGGTPTYLATSVYRYHTDTSDDSAGTYVGVSSTGLDTEIVLGAGIGNVANEGYSGIIYMDNLGDAVNSKKMTWSGSCATNTPAHANGIGAGRYISATAVTAIRILMHSGNITSGEFTLYGMRQ